MIKHTIKLEGEAAHGARVSARVLQTLLDTLLDAVRRSLRLRVEGRSNLQGRATWLEAAVDFQLVGLEKGSTVLEVEAPLLREVAPEIFAQLPLWDNVSRPEQSAFGLFQETVREATEGNIDSDLLDRHVLESISNLHRILDFGFQAIVLDGGRESRPVTITPEGIHTAKRLRDEAPPLQRVIVSGYLDQLTGSKRAFTLLLASGQSLRGLLPFGDLNAYRDLWAKKVVVDSEATFRPSGNVSLISATHIRLATEADAVWEQLPRPRPRTLNDLKPANPAPPGTNGIERIFGRWPGNETDAEIEAALEEIS